MHILWSSCILVYSIVILCGAEDINLDQNNGQMRIPSSEVENMETYRTHPTWAPPRMTLDIYNHSTIDWIIESVMSKTYLYYFDDPVKINKSLLNLPKPEGFDLNQFEGVEGVWVFPHKHFFSPPAETLSALFAYSGMSKFYENIQINYYAYKGGEVNVFTYEGDTPIATFKGGSSTGWQNGSTNLPSTSYKFRIEVRAEAEGDFVFIDKIIAGPRQDEGKTEGPPTSPISEIPVSGPSTIDSSNPDDWTKTPTTTDVTTSSTAITPDLTPTTDFSHTKYPTETTEGLGISSASLGSRLETLVWLTLHYIILFYCLQ